MPVIFKIFLFLILQQGGKVLDAKGGDRSINIETILLSSDIELTLQGDPGTIDRMMGICTIQDSACELIRESGSKAVIQFKNLSHTNKARIMERSQSLLFNNRIQFSWNENPTTRF